MKSIKKITCSLISSVIAFSTFMIEFSNNNLNNDSSYINSNIINNNVLEVSATTSLSNEEIIFQFLITEMNLNNAAACGVLANIEKESNFRSDLLEYGYTWASGGGYGICQWTNYPRKSLTGRRTDLVNFCNANGYDYTSLIGQLYYLKHELETIYYNKVYSALLNVSNDAQGAYNAGYRWCYSFEIPYNYPSVSITRANLAKNKYWEKYKDYSICDCNQDNANGKYIVNSIDNTVIPMLEEHDINSNLVAIIPNGTEVTVTKSNGKWAHVIWEEEGYTGICNINYLVPISEYDVNNDTYFDINDIILLKQYLLSVENLSVEQAISADINNDNLITIEDFITLKQIFLNLNS